MSSEPPERPLEFWKTVEIMQIDLAEAIRRGVLEPVELAPMLRNCAQCVELRKCLVWQKGPRRGAPTIIPEFCPNRQALAALAAKAPAPALRR